VGTSRGKVEPSKEDFDDQGMSAKREFVPGGGDMTPQRRREGFGGVEIRVRGKEPLAVRRHRTWGELAASAKKQTSRLP